MNSKFFGLVLLTILQFEDSHQSRILFLLPVASKSHVHVFEPLVKSLGGRGHEITFFASQKLKNVSENVQQIVVVEVSEIFKDMQNPFEMREAGKLAALTNSNTDYIDKTCEAVFDSPEMKEMLTSGKFDLVVVDIMLNYCMLGLLPHFKAPYIFITTMVGPSFVMDPTGNRLPPSFIPSPFLEYADRMTFSERVVNWIFSLVVDIAAEFLFIADLEKIYQRKLAIDTTANEIVKNVSMILSNTHFTLTYPRPYLPDVVDIGGMHTRNPGPLPKDLEEFISGGENGCIFFSLGSIAQGKDMPDEYRKMFLQVFSTLKERVLWKWENETMAESLPKNVKLIKWAPQQDILGHGNVKLFISHGGLLSIQETIYHGVPLLGIPLFADQDLNIKQAETAGFAVSMEIVGMTEKILAERLNEVLGNAKYAAKVKELSTIWRDQPNTPLSTAVFWTEYVIRHKGAPHLKSASRDLNFFQYHSLDVIAFIFSIILGVIYIFKCFIKLMWRRCFKKSVSIDNSSSKKRN